MKDKGYNRKSMELYLQSKYLEEQNKDSKMKKKVENS